MSVFVFRAPLNSMFSIVTFSGATQRPVFGKDFVMLKSGSDPLALSLVSLGKDSKCLRVASRKMRKILRTGINTPAQAEQASALYSDAYGRLSNPRYDDWPGISSLYQDFWKEMSVLLTGFDRYLTDSQASLSFQQQCLAEMALLAPSTSGSDSVVFEMQSDAHFRSACVRLYQPPTIRERASVIMETNAVTPVFGPRIVVQTPRWVHAVMAADLVPVTLSARWTLYPATEVGYPSATPSSDILESALRLWQDAPEDGVYTNFFDALVAVQLLI